MVRQRPFHAREIAAATALLLTVAACAPAATAPTAAPATEAPASVVPASVAPVTAPPATEAPATAPVASAAPASAAPAAGSAIPWPGAPLTTTPMSAADSAAIDALAADVLSKGPGLPGLWIGVWDPAKGYYIQGYGEAVRGGAKATPADHGRIGSVTKTFTVTAVLEQVAAGKLALDATIAQVLPELAAKYPAIGPVTVAQLAGMRSGIADYANTGIVIKDVAADPAKVWTADSLIDAALTLPLSAPGTGGYSTTNTLILGKMLEKVTGKSIDEIVTDVATRAGLTSSALQPADVTAMPAPASHGYVTELGVASMNKMGVDVPAGTDVSDWTLSWGQAGGGMYSTMEDLGTWAGTGLGTALLPADLAAQRLTFTATPEGRYGLGIMDFGGGWIGHTGQVIGWESIVLYNPATGAAFVAIVNETASLLAAEAVAAQVFPDLISLILG